MRPMFPSRLIAAALLASVAAAGIMNPAHANETAITCANTTSGASWQIKVDYGKSTVDSNEASISDGQISWHDAKDGGHYTLDRKSGDLTVVVASSTGGYFIYDRCRLEK